MNLAIQYIPEPTQETKEPMQYVPGLGFQANEAGTSRLFSTNIIYIIIALTFL